MNEDCTLLEQVAINETRSHYLPKRTEKDRKEPKRTEKDRKGTEKDRKGTEKDRKEQKTVQEMT